MKDEGLPDSVQVMLPSFHHPLSEFLGRYTTEKGFANVVFDVHRYQVFGDPGAGWCKQSLAYHLRFATAPHGNHDIRRIAEAGERVVVSEFSVKLPTWHTKWMIAREYASLTKSERTLLQRSFALRQLRCFAKYSEGWFFWSWKDHAGPEWDFAACTSLGWMPNVVKNSMAGASNKSSEANPKQIKVATDSSKKRLLPETPLLHCKRQHAAIVDGKLQVELKPDFPGFK